MYPTTSQFISALKSCMINNLTHGGSNVNCERGPAELLHDLLEFLSGRIEAADEEELYHEVVPLTVSMKDLIRLLFQASSCTSS